MPMSTCPWVSCLALSTSMLTADMLTEPSAPMQISNQLRRVGGVRQALEDVHEDQEVKGMSPVSLASSKFWSIFSPGPDSVLCACGKPACWHAPQLSKAWRLPRSTLSFSKLMWGQACVTATCVKQQAV